MNGVLPNHGAESPVHHQELPDLRAYTEQLLASGTQDLYRALLGTVDRVALAAVLRHVGGNQVRASEVLGISRTTLRGKLRAAGLSADGRRRAAPGTNGAVAGEG
ncbi:MAG TPA: helix-turn-helix domain-containing protein [Urbifossiella sp.]|nr:helix-turn-helix domain-containing protein [Urbifossiella sp.]